MRYFLEMAFRGDGFAGWQKQPNAASVQAAVEDALGVVLKEDIALTGAGRTDAGVHAYRMFAHFDSRAGKLNEEMPFSLFGKHLPASIRLRSLIRVSPQAHARFSALSRTYRYYIDVSNSPFRRYYAYPFYKPLDINAMQLACQSLIGKKDFSAFARSGSDNIHFECDVLYAGWVQQQDVLVFEIRANRFLRNMVRAIVGTMIDIGRKKMSLPEFDEIIAGRNRSAAGVSAQARGLFLWDIAYPPDIFIAD